MPTTSTIQQQSTSSKLITTDVNKAALGSSPPIIADTGCTSHFLSTNARYSNKRPVSTPLRVSLPDHSTMQSTHVVDLHIPDLPPEACIAHLFPALGDTSLISIGQLCDAGCIAIFTSDTVKIQLHDKVLLQGTRSLATNRLWTLELPSPPVEHAQTAVANSASPADLVAYAHASLFSPALSTLNTALRIFFVNIPGLTEKTLAKYPPASVPMHKGHLDQ